MQEITSHPQGSFSWADLSTTDQDGARSFYTELFGWQAQEFPMGEGMTYTMLFLDGKAVGALSQIGPEFQEQGMQSHWNTYVTVDNADEMTQKAEELGATVIEQPFDVFDQGRMSLIQDPTGAMLALWQPVTNIGAGVLRTPGAMTWNELNTRDAEKAQAFFSELFGWRAEQQENGYVLLFNGDEQAGGMMTMDEEWGDAPSHWMVYFAVDDADETARRVEELGGTVLNGPFDVPMAGRMAVIQDPQGAVFSVLAEQ
jgi:predicted enzyme related to lactoylglutathione lyase